MKKIIALTLLYSFCIAANNPTPSPLEESWQKVSLALSPIPLQKMLFERLSTLKIETEKKWSELEQSQDVKTKVKRFTKTFQKYMENKSEKNKIDFEKLAMEQCKSDISFIDEKTHAQLISLVELLKRQLNNYHNSKSEEIRESIKQEKNRLKKHYEASKNRAKTRHKRALTKMKDLINVPGLADMSQDNYIKAKNDQYLKTKSLMNVLEERHKKRILLAKKQLHNQTVQHLECYDKANKALNEMQNTLLILMPSFTEENED